MKCKKHARKLFNITLMGRKKDACMKKISPLQCKKAYEAEWKNVNCPKRKKIRTDTMKFPTMKNFINNSNEMVHTGGFFVRINYWTAVSIKFQDSWEE